MLDKNHDSGNHDQFLHFKFESQLYFLFAALPLQMTGIELEFGIHSEFCQSPGLNISRWTREVSSLWTSAAVFSTGLKPLIHSSIYSSIYSFIHSFIHSFTHSFISALPKWLQELGEDLLCCLTVTHTGLYSLWHWLFMTENLCSVFIHGELNTAAADSNLSISARKHRRAAADEWF